MLEKLITFVIGKRKVIHIICHYQRISVCYRGIVDYLFYEQLIIKTKKNSKGLSSTVLKGLMTSPIHRCYPATVERGNFCLLCFHPGPIRSSLYNLVNLSYPEFTILTLNFARTPDLHRSTVPRIPALMPFTNPSLQVAGLQACATTPG